MLEQLKCHRCGTTVRVWETWKDARTGDQVYRAYCHGEVDECRIDWRGLGDGAIVEALAFQQQKALR